jgi:hypothetical protein
MKRALFLGCSRRKESKTDLLPAIERYDGPSFRVLRRYLRDETVHPLHIWILSARFGLLPAEQQIPLYEEYMTPQRVDELRPVVLETFISIWHLHSFEEVFVSLGANYTPVMSTCWTRLPGWVKIKYASGSIGGRCSQLHTWLRGNHTSKNQDLSTRPAGRATLQGVTIEMSTSAILQLAYERSVVDGSQAERWQTWYIPVGEKRVAPKWLVNVLTELPVSRFRTYDALRFLNALGVMVLRQ